MNDTATPPRRPLAEQARLLLDNLDGAETPDELSTTMDCVRRFLASPELKAVLAMAAPHGVSTAITELLDQLEDYGFTSQGGPLANCVDWKRLRALAALPPQYVVTGTDLSVEALAEPARPGTVIECGGCAPPVIATPPESAQVPAGWRLVPVDQTPDMVNAHRMYGDTSDWWGAVLAASPEPPGAKSGVLTESERSVIETLLNLAYAAWGLADNTEDSGGEGLTIERSDFASLEKHLDALAELPDDQPGYTMGEAAKARWALRRVLDDAETASPEPPTAAEFQHGGRPMTLRECMEAEEPAKPAAAHVECECWVIDSVACARAEKLEQLACPCPCHAARPAAQEGEADIPGRRLSTLVDDLIYAGRIIERYERPEMKPLSEQDVRVYESARRVESSARRRLAQPVGEVDEAAISRAEDAFLRAIGTEVHVAMSRLPILKRKQAMRAALTAARLPKPAAGVVPGVMHCAKCKFRLVRTNFYVANGAISAGDNKTEPCPNGCGPLWPVTWEQEARECWERLEVLAARQPAEAPPAMGYYLASFKQRGHGGEVLWWGPDDRGYTPDLAQAGIYSNPTPRYHDNEFTVPVPVAFIDRLRVRRTVDPGDSLNTMFWSADELRAALRTAALTPAGSGEVGNG